MRFYRRRGRPLPKALTDIIDARNSRLVLQQRLRRVKVAAVVMLAAFAGVGAGVALLVRHWVR
jgi:hypothetical protein